MQPRVKDDVLQKHPNVNDAPFSFVSPWCLRLFDRSHLSSADTMWLQGDAVVCTLQEFQITRRALLDLHIQILQSNLVLSVGLFHNRDFGFVSVSPLTIFRDRQAFLCCLVKRFQFVGGQDQSSTILHCTSFCNLLVIVITGLL